MKLLVLEITELEDRKPHPDFVLLADTRDIVFAPLFINTRYLADMVRLPGRQADCSWRRSCRKSHGWRLRLISRRRLTRGANLDRTDYLLTLDGVNHSLEGQHTFAQMEALRLQQEAEITPPVLPASLEWLEYQSSRAITSIEYSTWPPATATEDRIPLPAPRYGGPPAPESYERLYAHRAGLINTWPAVQDFRLWGDDTHLNGPGSHLATDAVAGSIVAGRLHVEIMVGGTGIEPVTPAV